MLRTAYRPWFMKKRLEEFESIGIERDLAGLPIMWLPTADGSDCVCLIHAADLRRELPSPGARRGR
jgi:hypothetical protein